MNDFEPSSVVYEVLPGKTVEFPSSTPLFVDLGCDIGAVGSTLFASSRYKGCNYLGIDGDQRKIDNAIGINSLNNKIRFINGDVFELSSSFYGSADVVLLKDFGPLTNNPDLWFEIVDKAYQLLKPNGELYWFDYITPSSDEVYAEVLSRLKDKYGENSFRYEDEKTEHQDDIPLLKTARNSDSFDRRRGFYIVKN